ncbi:hypothetical protein CYLTODRAFT_456365, partial [Cylindrobasidium torrendii FP15055 ss-10]
DVSHAPRFSSIQDQFYRKKKASSPTQSVEPPSMDDDAEDLAVHWLDQESEIVEGLFLGEDLAGHANLFHSRIIGILQDNASVPVAAPEASVPDELPQVGSNANYDYDYDI